MFFRGQPLSPVATYISPVSLFFYTHLSLLLSATGGEQHVPGVSDGKQFRVLHHVPHSGAGPRRHQDEGGHAAGLRTHPQLQLLCKRSA